MAAAHEEKETMILFQQKAMRIRGGHDNKGGIERSKELPLKIITTTKNRKRHCVHTYPDPFCTVIECYSVCTVLLLM